MNFYSIQDIPSGYGEKRIFRTSVFNHVLFVFICLVLAVSCFWFGSQGGYHSKNVRLPSFFLYWVGSVALLSCLIGYSYLKATLRPSNWLVIIYIDCLLIKFRSYLNDHFPKEDLVVAEIPLSEIEWVRKTREKMSAPGLNRGGEALLFTTYLDLKLNAPEISRLRELVREEVNRKAPKIGISRTKHKDFPVRVLETGIARVEWKGVRPRIGRALEILDRKLRVEPELYIRSEKWYGLEGQDLETRIIDLAEGGKTIQAVSLVRQKYGYSLAESKKFIEELFKS